MQKAQKDKKERQNSFPKVSGENADLYNVLNKIMTTHK